MLGDFTVYTVKLSMFLDTSYEFLAINYESKEKHVSLWRDLGVGDEIESWRPVHKNNREFGKIFIIKLLPTLS